MIYINWMQFLSKPQNLKIISAAKLILKSRVKGIGLRKTKTKLINRNEVGRINLIDFKTYIIKAVWYWWRHRDIDQWNWTEDPEIDPHKHSLSWFLTEMPKQFNGVKTAFSTNSVGAIGHPKANE